MTESFSESTISTEELNFIAQELFNALGQDFKVDMLADTLSIRISPKDFDVNTITQYQMKDKIYPLLNTIGYTSQLAACIPPHNKGYIEWVQIYDIQEVAD